MQTIFAGYGVAGARNPLLNLGFNNDGTLFVQTGAVNYRGPTDANGYLIVAGNVRMPVGQQIDFYNGLDRKTAFLKTDYELTPFDHRLWPVHVRRSRPCIRRAAAA